MVAVICVDAALTLSGQSGSYWTDPSTADEGNHLVQRFLAKGHEAFLIMNVAYIGASFFLVSLVPARFGLTLLSALVLGHFFGGASWICFRHRLGVAGLAAYALVVALAVVTTAFPFVWTTRRSR